MFPTRVPCAVHPLDHIEIQPSPAMGAVHVAIEQQGQQCSLFVGFGDVMPLIDALKRAAETLIEEPPA